MSNYLATEIDEIIRFDPRIVKNGNLIEVIVKYNGNIISVGEQTGAEVEILSNNYAILTLLEGQVPLLYNYPEIEYIELPKTLTFLLKRSMGQACIPPVRDKNRFGLRGKGTIIGIIDSGIDYTHPDFLNEDGTSRVLFFWDQTRVGVPPTGFKTGIEYNNEQINEILNTMQGGSVVFGLDENGHGTAVSGIAAGNGRSSNGREEGAAPEASIIVVKLGQTGFEAFARSTEVMRAIKYISDKAIQLNMPVAINISFGTNNGSHNGSSLFETYIDSMAERWKTVIVVATGNEGSAGHHYSNIIKQGESINVEFVTTGNLSKMYMTFWKNFADTFTLELISPGGQTTGVMRPITRLTSVNLEGVEVSVFFGQPNQYRTDQEKFFLFDGRRSGIPQGIWRLVVTGEQVVDGRFNIWLPTIEDVTNDTAFTLPSVGTTLTLPSTAKNVISVGGYNSNIGSAADFSGRGYTRSDVYVKPDILAPAVGIITTRTGGGYDSFTGTSAAAPFVTGSAALMMEWGIVRGNDPFLYGQRVKAFLQKGARRERALPFPNPLWGYGTLCLNDTMELLTQYVRGGISI